MVSGKSIAFTTALYRALILKIRLLGSLTQILCKGYCPTFTGLFFTSFLHPGVSKTWVSSHMFSPILSISFLILLSPTHLFSHFALGCPKPGFHKLDTEFYLHIYFHLFYQYLPYFTVSNTFIFSFCPSSHFPPISILHL